MEHRPPAFVRVAAARCASMAIVATAAIVVVVALASGMPAGADVPPQSPSTTAAPQSSTTALNPAAGDTGSGSTGTIVFVAVTAIIVVGALLIFWRARANRLSGSA